MALADYYYSEKDQIACWVSGYPGAHSSEALAFAEKLVKDATAFAEKVGCDPKQVCWKEVLKSSWCKYMIVYYVPEVIKITNPIFFHLGPDWTFSQWIER